ncbi:MAG: helix-hairpin-helix domain-containing protein [Candidatus Poseidonia sp.]|nr:helix-hairpin-helix domain-containing protein [Poseidonia sp.]
MGKENPKNDLTSLPGVGNATAKKLMTAKLTTVAKIATSTPAALKKAGLSASVATSVLKAAKAANKAKQTATKAKKTAKKGAKKATTSAKKATSKVAQAAKKQTQKALNKSTKVAEKVVEKTTSVSGLKSTKDGERKGSNIKVPKSVKDMPWFKKR